MVLAAAMIAAVGAGVARTSAAPVRALPAALEAAAPSADPLTQKILEASTANPDGAVTSAVRLSPELTGVDHDQVLTLRAGAR